MMFSDYSAIYLQVPFISALFMLDAGQTLYLWQGWFPVDTSDTSDDSDTGNIVTTGMWRHVSIIMSSCLKRVKCQ